jgi:NAD(P)-dependent dehydrogenase (short-subunit alcohol dehydrogenase family)
MTNACWIARRFATPRDLADGLMFLASDASASMTGRSLDDGWSAL